jgi:hypothetical protein
MRTTFDIDDDVLQAVREISQNRQTTAGKVLSGLARAALASRSTGEVRNGVPLIPVPNEAKVHTTRDVNSLRD